MCSAIVYLNLYLKCFARFEMLKYFFQKVIRKITQNQSLISTFVKAGDRDRVMCTKYKWSVYGYHRLPSLKEDVVLHTTRQSLKTPSPKKEDNFH